MRNLLNGEKEIKTKFGYILKMSQPESQETSKQSQYIVEQLFGFPFVTNTKQGIYLSLEL